MASALREIGLLELLGIAVSTRYTERESERKAQQAREFASCAQSKQARPGEVQA